MLRRRQEKKRKQIKIKGQRQKWKDGNKDGGSKVIFHLRNLWNNCTHELWRLSGLCDVTRAGSGWNIQQQRAAVVFTAPQKVKVRVLAAAAELRVPILQQQYGRVAINRLQILTNQEQQQWNTGENTVNLTFVELLVQLVYLCQSRSSLLA